MMTCSSPHFSPFLLEPLGVQFKHGEEAQELGPLRRA